jgi:hypothetical protein
MGRPKSINVPVFHPSDIIGKTFLMDSYRKMVNAFEREWAE